MKVVTELQKTVKQKIIDISDKPKLDFAHIRASIANIMCNYLSMNSLPKKNEMKISYLLNVPCIFYIALLKWGIICLPVILSLSQCFWSLFSFSKSCRNTNDSGNCVETGDSLHGHLPTRRLSSFQAVKRIIKRLAFKLYFQYVGEECPCLILEVH